jgi:hypothetical protein
MSNYSITEQDRKIIRDLAKKQYEYAQMTEMQELTKLWYKHNDLTGKRPMVTIETWTFGQDIPKDFKCTSEIGRDIEDAFYNIFANYEYIGDDKVIPPFFPVSISTWFKPFDITVEAKYVDGSLGHQFIAKINDLEEDFPRLKKSTYRTTSREESDRWKGFLEYIFGDTLTYTE